MKRAVSLIVAFTFCLALCACGHTEDTQENEIQSETASQTTSNICDETVIEETDENTYETPLNAYMEYMSTPFPAFEKIPAVYNGWAENEVKAIFGSLQKALDELEWNESVGGHRFWQSPFESYESEFGKDAKMSYEIKEIKELSQEQLEEYKESIDSFAKQRRDHWNKEDYVARLVANSQISEMTAKELMDACRNYIDKMENAVVEEGYLIKTTVTISSSTLEEDQQRDWTICVYKIAGRWVMAFSDSKNYLDPVSETMFKLGLF